VWVRLPPSVLNNICNMNIKFLKIEFLLSTLILTIIPIIANSQQLKLVKSCNNSREEIDSLIILNNRMYFTIRSDIDTTLWVTDGSQSATKKAVFKGDFKQILSSVGNKLFFISKLGFTSYINVLKNIQDSAEAIYEITEIEGGVKPSFKNIGSFGNKLFFEFVFLGDSIWVTDGTPEGTKKSTVFQNTLGIENYTSLSLIDTIENKSLILLESYKQNGRYQSIYIVENNDLESKKLMFTFNESYDFPGLVRVKNNFFTTFSTSEFGDELFKINGDSCKFSIVKDITPGPANSHIHDLFSYKDNLFFVEGNINRKLWKTDGTGQGTNMITDIEQVDVANLKNQFFPFKDKFCFDGDDGIHNVELWITDGTKEGTNMVADICTGANPSCPIEPYQYGDKLYFSADDCENGRQLWVTDGTNSGTKMVKEIKGLYGSFPENLISSNDILFFTAGTESNLFRTDGTETGTYVIRKTRESMGEILKFKNFSIFNNKLYFTDNLICVSDGTIEGTKSILSPYNDTNYYYSSYLYPLNYFQFNNCLYFLVRNTSKLENIQELWTMEQTNDVHETKYDINVRLYPNPATDILTVVGVENKDIEIYSILGNKVFDCKYNSLSTKIIKISSFHQGLYILKTGGKIYKFFKI
ncbi:MAG: T9SS type A sorting domain-containing protein, partial [FCB group bacterium]